MDATQHNEENGFDRYPSQEWDGTQTYADGSGAVTEYDPEYAAQSSTEEARAFTSDGGKRGSRGLPGRLVRLIDVLVLLAPGLTTAACYIFSSSLVKLYCMLK